MSGKSTETIPPIIKYFRDLHLVLKEEAKLAGLIGHNASIGAAREFFVKRILRSFLPPYVHIGSGQIMNHLGERSRQMDVIIYDPKFPFFDIAPGTGVYLYEGVIATVEIKTSLGKRELRSSLRNCESACSLDFLNHAGDYQARISETAIKEETDKEQANRMLDRRLAAKSYIFAYRTTLSAESMAEGLLEHIASLRSADDWDPRMPRIVVGDGLLAASADADNVKLSLSEEERQQLISLTSPVGIVYG